MNKERESMPIMPEHDGDAWQDKEQTRTEGYRDNLHQPERFKAPTAAQLKKEAERHMTPRRRYRHEDHADFVKFYSTLDYDQRTEFARKQPEEKEAIFLQWLEDRKKKTA